MIGPEIPENRLKKRLHFFPFFLVLGIFFCILYFVGYPVERYFLGNRVMPPESIAPFPRPGSVGYLKTAIGGAIFASPDLKALLFWEKQLNDPVRSRLAKEAVENGTILILPNNILALSVTPENGGVRILGGRYFGKILYIRTQHVHFVVLSK